MKKNKLTLNDLKVKSFVTDLNKELAVTLNGGRVEESRVTQESPDGQIINVCGDNDDTKDCKKPDVVLPAIEILRPPAN